MKKILLVMALCSLAIAGRGQDAAIEERLNKLDGKLQDLLESKDALQKQIDGLNRQIGELRDQQSKPSDNYATRDDLRKLADSIEKNRREDTEKISQTLDELRKSLIASASAPRPRPPVVQDNPHTRRQAGHPEKGFEYVIKSGDSLSAIAKTYRDNKIKVSVEDILKANPGLKAERLIVGKTIFIPAPQ